MAAWDEFEREQAILLALETSGRVAGTDLVARFGVSAVTVRKDLDALERRGLLRRIRGGAVSVGTADEGAFEMRLRHSRDAKLAIARIAAQQVDHGDVIALDSSTTAYLFAHEIIDRRDLVVVTNGLRPARLFMEQSTAMVLMPGGAIRRSSESLVGPIADVLSGRGRISKGFFGAVGLSTDHGLMEIAVEEAQTKRFLADACDQVYGLLDSAKAGRFALHSFAAVERITAIYTDDEIATDIVAEWTALGVPVHTASADPAVLPLRAARP